MQKHWIEQLNICKLLCTSLKNKLSGLLTSTTCPWNIKRSTTAWRLIKKKNTTFLPSNVFGVVVKIDTCTNTLVFLFLYFTKESWPLGQPRDGHLLLGTHLKNFNKSTTTTILNHDSGSVRATEHQQHQGLSDLVRGDQGHEHEAENIETDVQVLNLRVQWWSWWCKPL